MVMNVKMEARTWEQLLFILLQITQLTLPEAPPRKRADTLGGRLAQAIFQTLIVTWIKANLYVVVSTELWDQFLEVLSGLTLWEELIKEWAKTMETLTRVLARQVYNLDLNDLPLDRLSERATKKRRGKQAPQEMKNSSSVLPQQQQQHHMAAPAQSPLPPQPQQSPLPPDSHGGGSMSSSTNRESPYGVRKRLNSEGEYASTGSHHGPPQSKGGARQSKGRRGKGRSRKVQRSHSDSSIPAKLSEWRREVLRVQQEFRLVNEETRKRMEEAGGPGARRKRHRSADSVLSLVGVDGGRFSESDDGRSSSPAPSSGIGCNSIKDSPLQLDHDAMSDGGMSDHQRQHQNPHHRGLQHHSSNHYLAMGAEASSAGLSGGEQPRSVMSGGSVKGWLPDVAVVLWRRMLGALGNVNHIADTVIHAMVYKYLVELFDILVRIRANQGVSLDNTFTPPQPDYVPPFTIFAPWCFRALSLPDTYQRGRLYALRYEWFLFIFLQCHDIVVL